MAGIDKSMLEFLFVGPLFSIFKKLNAIDRKLEDMASQEDVNALAARVSAVGAQQVKAVGEVKTEVQALKDQLANQPVPVELDFTGLDAAVTAAEQGSQELDDLNPDAPVEPTPETPAEPVDEVPATPAEDA